MPKSRRKSAPATNTKQGGRHEHTAEQRQDQRAAWVEFKREREMKLIFETQDIQQMLIEKAKSMGIDADAVEFDVGYGCLKSASVHKQKKQQGSEVTALIPAADIVPVE
jgi:hypothetical protein